jgi:hypothetical protein
MHVPFPIRSNQGQTVTCEGHSKEARAGHSELKVRYVTNPEQRFDNQTGANPELKLAKNAKEEAEEEEIALGGQHTSFARTNTRSTTMGL